MRVMPGLVPGIHVLTAEQQERRARSGWMAGTSIAKTHFALLAGHDGNDLFTLQPLLWMRNLVRIYGPLSILL